MKRILLAAALMALPALPAAAQMRDMPGMHHDVAPAGPGADAPSSKAYQDAMAKMHSAMAVPYTGNADADFVAGMEPHHQGAIDMARVELQYGKDPALRRLARDIIAAQQKEIAFMQRWQAAHPQPH
jgi:uncharacterized protein (DUF305 family)